LADLNVKPTRIELIQIRKRIKLAKRGHQLLKMKRSALIMEFMNMARGLRGMKENLRRDVERALEKMTIAEVREGRMKVENYAFMSGSAEVSMKARNVMGVKIPNLGISMEKAVLTERFRAISVPPTINDAMNAYERLFRSLVEVVEKEKAMRHLLAEIDKTKRRSNAIEFVMIPKLKSQSDYIRMRLDEMERDTFTTLKFVKKKMMSQEEDDNKEGAVQEMETE
jgi:H(+)-transporting ATP synthase, vacuolar type, subunit D